MANELVSKLIEAGAHFGHRVSRWNPKMAPYIYGRKNLIHIIDIRETLRGMLRAKKYLQQVASGGSLVLFVGTERWLGGCLTNFRTIRDRMGRLEELESIINSDAINGYSKKMQSALNREYRKIYRNLNGIRTLNRTPECLVIIDPKKEKNAIREAKALGITTVALIDTDCDPTQVDLPIPGNDDGIRSIDLIVKQLADAVLAGKSENPELMKTVPQAAAPSETVSEMAAMAEKEALD
jgi:small subunit ribosomal protein S2